MLTQSSTVEQISPALVAAQSEIGGAVKGSANPFFKSKYADLNAVIGELKPVYSKHGLTVIQFPYSDENGVGVTTRVIHASGEWIEGSFTLPLAKNDPQAAGSAITYAKRYALKGIGLMPDLDDDAEAAMYRTTEPYTPEQKAKFNALLAAGDGWGLKQLAHDLGVDGITELFNSAPKGEKTALKDKYRAAVNAANTELKETVAAIQAALSESEKGAIEEIFADLEPLPAQFVNAALSEIEHVQIQQLSDRAA